MTLKKKTRSLKTKGRLLLRGLRYRPILGFADLGGWLRFDEAAKLFDLARALPEDHALVVEIGSWLGKSSLVLAKGLSGKRNPELHCIDPFNCAGDEVSAANYQRLAAEGDLTLLERFNRNMERGGVRDIVFVKQGFSHDFSGTFTHPIDMLFIDGDHSYASVRRDFEEWSPKVKPGGILAFHDVDRTASPGPRQVIDELVARDRTWERPEQVGSLFVVRRATPDGACE